MFEINNSSYVCVLEAVKSRQERVNVLMERHARPRQERVKVLSGGRAELRPRLVWAMTLLTGYFAGLGPRS